MKLKVKEELCRAQQCEKVKPVFINGKIYLWNKRRSQDEGRHCRIVPDSSHPPPQSSGCRPNHTRNVRCSDVCVKKSHAPALLIIKQTSKPYLHIWLHEMFAYHDNGLKSNRAENESFKVTVFHNCVPPLTSVNRMGEDDSS